MADRSTFPTMKRRDTSTTNRKAGKQEQVSSWKRRRRREGRRTFQAAQQRRLVSQATADHGGLSGHAQAINWFYFEGLLSCPRSEKLSDAGILDRHKMQPAKQAIRKVRVRPLGILML